MLLYAAMYRVVGKEGGVKVWGKGSEGRWGGREAGRRSEGSQVMFLPLEEQGIMANGWQGHGVNGGVGGGLRGEEGNDIPMSALQNWVVW